MTTPRRPPAAGRAGSARHAARGACRVAALACAVSLAAATACGGGGGPAPGQGAVEPSSEGTADGGPAPAVSVDDLAVASGHAPAVTAVAGLAAPGPPRRTALPGVGESAASITGADGSVTACCLMVAADPAARRRGLMEVTDLGGYEGMVFVWDADTSGGFWMRDTPMPLSIAFFAADGAFVGADDMEPCGDSSRCPVYPAPGTYRFALEVARGGLDALGAVPGSRLALGGGCSAVRP